MAGAMRWGPRSEGWGEDRARTVMARALGVDASDLDVEEDSTLSSFNQGVAYSVHLGSKEYVVVENDEQANNLALEIVKQDLQNNPEIFNRDFIESNIDTKKLRDGLWSDVYDMRYEDLSQDAEQDPLRFMEDHVIDVPHPSEDQLKSHADAMSDDRKSADEILSELMELSPEDQWREIGEEPEVPSKDIDEIARDYAETTLEDPLRYLREFNNEEDAMKQAIEIAGIDVDKAAEEAVRTDGAGHFLSTYDGHLQDAPGGAVYWRRS